MLRKILPDLYQGCRHSAALGVDSPIRNRYDFPIQGTLWGLMGKTEKPSRSRRCDRGRTLHEATAPYKWSGKAQEVD
jgi:hypothetical protein